MFKNDPAARWLNRPRPAKPTRQQHHRPKSGKGKTAVIPGDGDPCPLRCADERPVAALLSAQIVGRSLTPLRLRGIAARPGDGSGCTAFLRLPDEPQASLQTRPPDLGGALGEGAVPVVLTVSLGSPRGTHTEASKSITVEAAAEAWIKRVEANGMRLSARGQGSKRLRMVRRKAQ